MEKTFIIANSKSTPAENIGENSHKCVILYQANKRVSTCNNWRIGKYFCSSNTTFKVHLGM